MNYVIKSIKCVKLYSTFYISHTIRTNGLLYLTGHNECPLLTILLTQESPTTFRMMFNAPFWQALESLYSVHILQKFGAICVISSTLLHFSCCKVKKNNSIIKILFHNFHIICYYMLEVRAQRRTSCDDKIGIILLSPCISYTTNLLIIFYE